MGSQRISIWADVQKHYWKYEARTRPVSGILWHATRGNQMYDGNTEYQATINWFVSENNRTPGGYAGISNYIVGPGVIVEAVPPEFVPRWSSWPSDLHAVSIEVAQSNFGQFIEQETIDSCVELALELEKRFQIPRRRVEKLLSDWNWSGHAGHAETVQGRSQGKTDPDDQFWSRFWPQFAQAQGGGDDYVTPQEFLMALKTNKALRDEFLAIVADELPIHYQLAPLKLQKLGETIRKYFTEALGKEFPDVGPADPVRWMGFVTRRLDMLRDAANKAVMGQYTDVWREIEQALRLSFQPRPVTKE